MRKILFLVISIVSMLFASNAIAGWTRFTGDDCIGEGLTCMPEHVHTESKD